MASSSSSSSISLRAKYDVFLSFRGEDTRNSFTSHLYAALCRKQVKTFIDFDGLKRGDEISPVLLKAIEDSMVSVIIFSEDYASSRWCLEELEKIIDCKERNGQMVVPVFYRVNALDVLKQSGSYEEAFVKHEDRFKGMTEKVEKWRVALSAAAKLPGLDSSLIKPESKLVEEIVAEILKKLHYISPSGNCEGLIGIDYRIEKVKSLLCIESSDSKVVGIWGMGGIGKTTIAGAVFSEMCSLFEGFYFCINVREESEKRGLVNLRNHILSQILEEKNLKFGTPRLPQYTRERLHRKKVLIVLDDVNEFEQLETLAGGLDRFGPGSRIIITTRNKQVLCSYGVDDIYEVERFNYNEALQLFCAYAFKKNHPPEGLEEISNRVLGYAKGNPLALKVLGSSLYRKRKEDWESVLHKFKMISNPKIHDVLKISYYGLDREEKDMFLDIACFFKGEDRGEVVQILDGCYSLDFTLNSLIDKSLITISNNKLQIHDLLQEMGQEIVRQESMKEPGKRSRLWYHEDIYHVLKNNKGTDSVEGIFLNMSKIRDVSLSSKVFMNMCNLRLIKFYNPGLYEENVEISKVHLQGLKYLPDKLRYLYWAGCPMKALPSKFCLENLVELKLPCSNVEQLWKGTKYTFKLKSIDLHKSQNLIEFPDLLDAPQLEIINLEECRSLAKVPPNIQYLNNLSLLCLRGCESLESFPSNINFGSLITLDLSYCINLTKFPQVSGKLIQLYLNGTAIEEVPASISCLTELVLLDMAKCTRLKSISTSICKLKSLYRLYLWNCLKLGSFPEILEKMERLEDLNLNGTAIKELPSSIEHLNALRNLELHDCKDLEIIPNSISNLTSLCEIDLSGCSKLDKLPENLGNLIFLKKLNAKGAAVSHLPSSISGLKEITDLDLSFCNLTEIPKDVCCISSLVVLDLSGNNFESLPTSTKQLSQLRFLYINNCNMLQSLPELPLCLEYLEAMNCKRLQSLPELPSSSKELDPSLPEIIFESCCPDALNTNDFIFTNCLSLNQKGYVNILADSQQRIQYVATASLRLCYEKVIDDTPAISFCLPGSEIPYWFHYQNPASSISIELPQHWCNRRFIGFALCAVVAFDEGGSYYDEAIYVRCSYQFEGSNVDRVQFSCNFMVSASLPDNVEIDSDHMVLGYSPFVDVKLLNGDYTKASFEFSPIKNFPIRTVKGCMVKVCGVCPLYVQPRVSEPNIDIEKVLTISQDFGETMAKEYIYKHADTIGSESCRSGEEEREPHPKRIRRYQIDSKEQ